MRRLLMLGMLSLAAAACGPSRAEVEVDWTFGGLSCADAGVDRIDFAVAGEVVSPDHYTCVEAGVGASLGSFLDGNYQLTVSGFDPAGNLVYQTTQTIQVRGTRKNVFPIDLPQVAQFTGDVTLHWTFGGQSCAAANVDHVTIFVDPDAAGGGGINAGTVPCSTAGTDGGSVDGLTRGTHSFAIQGIRTLADGPHLIYRTHNPPSSFFEIGLITDLSVSAELLP
jgi:hypothetical protein